MSAPQTEVLVFVDGRETARHILDPGAHTIGCSPECGIRIEAQRVSDRHAQLTVGDEGSLLLEDLGSASGTFLDGQRISAPTVVSANQSIQIGAAQILVLQHTVDGFADTTIAADRVGRPLEFSPTVRYEIGAEIAKGGMGAVLAARQSAIRREVALKVMLRDASAHDRLRFIEEAQITGQLEHPNIVPVHDLALNEHGQPYYTMKLVKGHTLKEILKLLAQGDAATLAKYPLAALLTIFQKVCDAVAFAHARGVLHRDLKPANIMVGEYGEVLVMDWGLAKRMKDEGGRMKQSEPSADAEKNTDARSAQIPSSFIPHPSSFPVTTARDDQHENFATLDGAVMGTPQYMSPEQARGEVATLDQRSDLFSLGAILYELVTLLPPFPGKTTREILSNIKSGHFVLPNVRLRTEDTLHPQHLPGGSIPDSLEAVISKALAIDRDRRYQHVAEFQADLTAYQDGFATSAEQAGLGKQLLLALRRHRREAAVAAAALLLLLILAVASFLRIRRERDLADAAKQRAVASKTAADELIYYMQYDLRDTAETSGRLKLMEGINARIQRYHQEHPPDPADPAAIDAADRARAVALEQQGGILSEQGDLPGALQCYRTCVAICEKLAQKDPGNTDRQRDLSLNAGKVGAVLKTQGDLPGALQSYRASLAIREKLAQKDPDNAEWQYDLSFVAGRVGDVLSERDDLSGALQSYRTSLAIAEKLAQKDPNNAGWQGALSDGEARMGDVLKARGDLPGALQSYRASLAICEKLAQKDPGNADRLHDLANSDYKVGRGLEAQGDLPGALQKYRECLAICEKLAPKDLDSAHWQRSLALSNNSVGDVLKMQSDLPGALQCYRASLAIAGNLTQKYPDISEWQRDLAVNNDKVGSVLKAQGDLPGALQCYRTSLAIGEKFAQKDPDNADWQRSLAFSVNNVGDVLKAQGDLPGALQSYHASVAIAEKLAQKEPDNTRWQSALAYDNEKIGDVLEAQGDRPGALQSYRACLVIREKLAQKNPDNSDWQFDLSTSDIIVGDILKAQDDLSGALECFRASLAIRAKLAQKDPDNARWQGGLAVSYERVGDVAQQQKRWAEAAAAFAHEAEIARPWSFADPADVEWLNSFTYGAASSWEVLRDAPKGAVPLDRAKVLADLRTARDRLQKLKEQKRLVPPMDKNLSWIEELIGTAERPSKAPARSP